MANVARRAKVRNVRYGREYLVIRKNLVNRSAEIFLNAPSDRTHKGPGLRLFSLGEQVVVWNAQNGKGEIRRA